MILFSLSLILLATIVYYILRYLSFWSRQGVKTLPFFNTYGLTEKHTYPLEMFKKYGGVYGGHTLSFRFLAINKPELIKEVLVKQFNVFPNRFVIHLSTSPKISQMLPILPGLGSWKRVKATMSRGFTTSKLKPMMAHIWDIADALVDNFVDLERKDEVIDMRHYATCFTLDVIAACAFGIVFDSNKDPDHPVITNVQKLLAADINLSKVTSIIIPKLAEYLNLSFFDVNATDYFGKLVHETRARRLSSNQSGEVTNKTDFIQIMLDSEISSEVLNSDETLEGITLDEVIAQGIVFFIGGQDTTVATLCHIVYHLAQNKDCQQRLYEELKDFDEFTMDNLKEHQYLNAVFSEVLRLSPPILRVQRTSVEDFVLDGIKVPSGTTVDVYPYALHRDPNLWTDPLKFNPERFIEETHDPFAYLPFGAGQRLCIGKRFAENEMRIITAKLFSKFEFDLAPGFSPEHIKGNILLMPKSMLVKIKLR